MSTDDRTLEALKRHSRNLLAELARAGRVPHLRATELDPSNVISPHGEHLSEGMIDLLVQGMKLPFGMKVGKRSHFYPNRIVYYIELQAEDVDYPSRRLSDGSLPAHKRELDLPPYPTIKQLAQAIHKEVMWIAVHEVEEIMQFTNGAWLCDPHKGIRKSIL